MLMDVSASALLWYGPRVLMMKRSMSRRIAPGLWAGVGGHLEPLELNDPTAACLREIHEETGISAHQIDRFQLRYIIHSQRGKLIYLQYYFAGWLLAEPHLGETEEGVLHLVEAEHLVGLETVPSVKELLKHYTEEGVSNSRIYLGSGLWRDGVREIEWVPLDDWDREA